ncbi:MAG: zinc metallopeptidase RseP, partial [bacterium]|nr:zinc metallopeptidase RseP [bacterium]
MEPKKKPGGDQIQRAEEYLQITVKTGSREIQGEEQGYLGVESLGLTEEQHMLIEKMRYRQQYGIFQAVGKGIDKTWEITLLSFRIIGKIFTGEVSPKNLSGPISIAKGAGAYASYGFVFFLGFLGMISVNLGIINLLPIPVLDGGHLLYYILELV